MKKDEYMKKKQGWHHLCTSRIDNERYFQFCTFNPILLIVPSFICESGNCYNCNFRYGPSYLAMKDRDGNISCVFGMD